MSVLLFTLFVMNVPWPTLAHEFVSDGSLRDIYIRSSSLTDWQQVLEFVRQHGTDPQYTVDGEFSAWPTSVAEVFATRSHASPKLYCTFGDIRLVSHFFVETEVEFDFLPGDVCNQQSLNALLSLLQQIGDLLAKPVLVTPENCMEDPFLTYQPHSGEFCVTPFSGNRYA